MDTNIEKTVRQTRLYFLDNIRTFMIFLVVLLHTGLVYESSGVGAFFWLVDDPATNSLAGKLNVIVDIFVMSVIFFIAGYLTPRSLASKSKWLFLKAKFKRLIVPWIFAVFVLIPIYKIIFLYSRDLPQESWTTYFHFSNGIFSQNWLWFLPVLFMFDVLYLALSKKLRTLLQIRLHNAVPAVFLIGIVYSVLMDLNNVQGWTKTFLLDFQNERLLVYFMIFLLGALVYEQDIFSIKPDSKRLYFAMLSTIWIFVYIYQYFHWRAFVYPGSFVISRSGDSLLMWIAFHFSLLGLLYLIVKTFRYFPNTQGRVARILADNSYNVYIIHTIVLGGIALIMLHTAMPSQAKYLISVVATYIASNGIVLFYKQTIKPWFLIRKKEKIEMKTALITFILVLAFVVIGCDSNKEADVTKQPPQVSIHLAALQGNVVAIQQHINAGTDLNGKDLYGSTPLIIAATFGQPKVAKALIDAGADLSVTNNDGSTPLHIASFLCREKIVKMLLEHGADTNVKNSFGSTPLNGVEGEFADVKGVYDSLAKGLKPLGLILDYERIEATRPKIAEMLRESVE
ncbi:MAG: hypothetical protein DWQ10_04070 [Calditrichaeota bacterium]|nr:MAG: hypothetical protein DWQ10_04070 [Calditrichota bacterium]